MPFDNLFVILELDGATTQQLLDKMADAGGYPISKGLTFAIKNRKAEDIMIGGNHLIHLSLIG